ncbi:MAG: 23S rRNA (uracil(1939)-C(5))-methyltransferase RlmD [Deltaproteobacteria bacterium]|nr:MAG: 23S rRNA (uracil(1939)-C(5))-methyltransferase RlmD [Deltaproteobacteria bacterium]
MGVGKDKFIEVEIENLAFGGRGIARVDGMVVFVEGAVPGDFVRAKIYKKKRQFAEARTIDVIIPSNKRKTPQCRYFGTCGGCKWQFLDYADQLDYKTSHVREAFDHIGLLGDVSVSRAIGSPDIFHYRNKMEFSFTSTRWLPPWELEDKSVIKKKGVGLHVPGIFNKIVDVEKCLIQPEKADSILDYIRNFMLDSAHDVYNGKIHEGFWRFVMIRHSVFYDSFMVNIVTGYEDKNEMEKLGKELGEKFPEIVSIVNNVSSKKANISAGDYEILIHGKNYITEKIGEYSFKISANSFFQTNTAGTKQLYDIVKEFADLKGDEFVMDLYTGTGSIALYLSEHAEKILGIEISESAVSDARINAELNSVTNCSFIAGDLKDVIKKLDEAPDVLVCDPPRAGMHKDVVSRILDFSPVKIVYVSCNPATMARDIAILKEKYNVKRVQPVDMFPHTHHIECIALLLRK